MSSTTIRVGYLARVEGEGAIAVRVRGRSVVDLRLKVFEPPRFFEAFLRGRAYHEVPDIVARICGICPVAHQITAAVAVEDAFGLEIPGTLRALRRLIYCGEWIESHALHIYLLHAPDFLGYDDAIQMARDHRAAAELGLRLKKLGNDVVALVGGREIHPVNVRVGGFYRVPTRAEMNALVAPLEWAVGAAEETVRWTAALPCPAFARAYEFVAVSHPQRYAIEGGHVATSAGPAIAPQEYEQHFVEEHVPYSNALRSKARERGAYLVGPLARYNLNHACLTPRARAAAEAAGLGQACSNPFQGIVIRAVETLYACEEALRIVRDYEPPDAPAVAAVPRAGTGYGCTEAPRGLLYHRYEFDASGLVQSARIVPPTAQNQVSMEDDLRQLVEEQVDLPADRLTLNCEQAVRNYDPCISCATHFLRLDLERERLERP